MAFVTISTHTHTSVILSNTLYSVYIHHTLLYDPIDSLIQPTSLYCVFSLFCVFSTYTVSMSVCNFIIARF